MKKNKKNSDLRRHEYFIFLIAILIFVLGLIFIILSFINKDSDNISYDYQVNKNIDYSVTIKNNPFYSERTLTKEKHYISSLVDYYKIIFKYDFIKDNNFELEYKYNIEATISANVEDTVEKEIWARKFILKNDKKGIIKNKKLYLEEKVDIDFLYYNDLVQEFKETYDINSDCLLKVKFNITYNIGKENIYDYLELDIVLGENITSASENYLKNNNKEFEFLYSEFSYLNFLLGTFLIVVSLSLIFLNRKRSYVSLYEKKKKNLLREYQDIIIEVLNMPIFDSSKVLNVSSFDNLVDLAYGHDSHIIFYEAIKNREGNFYVIIDNYAYIFTLKV